jgi:hypothetical protein
MIQLKDLDLGMTEVLDGELGSILGGIFGGVFGSTAGQAHLIKYSRIQMF